MITLQQILLFTNGTKMFLSRGGQMIINNLTISIIFNGTSEIKAGVTGITNLVYINDSSVTMTANYTGLVYQNVLETKSGINTSAINLFGNVYSNNTGVNIRGHIYSNITGVNTSYIIIKNSNNGANITGINISNTIDVANPNITAYGIRMSTGSYIYSGDINYITGTNYGIYTSQSQIYSNSTGIYTGGAIYSNYTGIYTGGAIYSNSTGIFTGGAIYSNYTGIDVYNIFITNTYTGSHIHGISVQNIQVISGVSHSYGIKLTGSITTGNGTEGGDNYGIYLEDNSRIYSNRTCIKTSLYSILYSNTTGAELYKVIVPNNGYLGVKITNCSTGSIFGNGGSIAGNSGCIA